MIVIPDFIIRKINSKEQILFKVSILKISSKLKDKEM